MEPSEGLLRFGPRLGAEPPLCPPPSAPAPTRPWLPQLPPNNPEPLTTDPTRVGVGGICK